MMRTLNLPPLAALVALSALAALITPASADPFVYDTEECGFTITLPNPPSAMTRCEGSENKRCYEALTYNQTFPDNGNLKMDIICSDVTPKITAIYTPQLMEKTLEAMASSYSVTQDDVSHHNTDTYKHASLIGASKDKDKDHLFIAQLWMNNQSAFSIQTHITGPHSKESDTLLSHILHSIKPRQTRRPSQAHPPDAKD